MTTHNIMYKDRHGNFVDPSKKYKHKRSHNKQKTNNKNNKDKPINKPIKTKKPYNKPIKRYNRTNYDHYYEEEKDEFKRTILAIGLVGGSIFMIVLLFVIVLYFALDIKC